MAEFEKTDIIHILMYANDKKNDNKRGYAGNSVLAFYSTCNLD